MKYFLVLSVITSVSLCVSGLRSYNRFPIKNNINTKNNRDANITMEYFTQKLDHFNSSDTRLFEQIIHVNADHYIEGGPIFVFIPNYMDWSPQWLANGNAPDIAEELNGILYGLEARFFPSSSSTPTGDFSVESLQYLTVEQTIEDYAEIITNIRQQLPTSEKVILYGINHGARMATWLKQKHPSLIDGVYAMSAPMYTALEFPEFLADIAVTYQNTLNITNSVNCTTRITNSMIEMVEIIESGNATRLENLFNLPTSLDLDDPQDIGLFFYKFSEIFSYNPENYRMGEVDTFCRLLVQKDIENDLEALANFVVEFYLGMLHFYRNYQDVVELYRHDQISDVYWGERPKFYMQCNQLSSFRTSTLISPISDKFGVDFWVKFCQDVFGPQFDKEYIENGNLLVNELHGGFNPDVNNVYFTHGGLNPVRLIGITEDLNVNSPADVIPGYGMGWDFWSSATGATPEMRAVIERARYLIIQWIQ